jgi:hypothetical protein
VGIVGFFRIGLLGFFEGEMVYGLYGFFVLNK